MLSSSAVSVSVVHRQLTSLRHGDSLVVDTATHVWSRESEQQAYPCLLTPPESLRNIATATDLGELMERTGVDKVLITQPINFKFDHSYLDAVIDAKRFYGIFLLNPEMSLEEGVEYIRSFERKKSMGYVGMRLNPALFESSPGGGISGVKGSALYDMAGQSGFPVNVMCFTGGVERYHVELVELIEKYPETKLVIDHAGFFVQEGRISEESWRLLLSLASYPQVYVKFSALFRISLESSPPYQVFVIINLHKPYHDLLTKKNLEGSR